MIMCTNAFSELQNQAEKQNEKHTVYKKLFYFIFIFTPVFSGKIKTERIQNNFYPTVYLEREPSSVSERVQDGGNRFQI